MDVNQGCSNGEIKDPPTESSWIPITPGKPGPSIQQSICKEKRAIGPSVPFWLNAARTSCTKQADIENGSQLGNSICFQPNAQAQNAREIFQNDSGNVRFAEAANSSRSMDASTLYFSSYNESLMQLKDDAAAAAKSHATPRARSSSSASAFTYPVQRSLFQAESSNSPLADKGLCHESGHQGTFNTDQTRVGDLRTGILYHSVPATPNLTETGNKEKVLDRPNCWVSEAAKAKEDNSLKHIAAEFSQNSSLVIDISCHSISKTLQENHEPDIGSHETVDIKTPQQKPRRRKHRPKVISADPLKAKRRITKPSCGEKLNVEKRKYVRKTKGSTQGNTPTKGSTQGDTPTEGRSETDPVSETIPRPKRKYTRRKGANETNSTATTEVVSGTTSPKSTKATRRSCKRSLNFDCDSTIADERSSRHQYVPDLNSKPTSHISQDENQMTSEMKLGEVLGAEKSLNNDLARSRKKGFEDYILIDEMESLCLSTPVKCNELHNKSMAGCLNESSRGKCRIIFSDTTHDKETVILDSRNQLDWGAKIPSSTSNDSNILSQETHAQGMKRSSADLSDKSRMNVLGQSNFFQNSFEARQSNKYKKDFLALHCPEMYKKKRTNNLQKSTSSDILPTVTAKNCQVQSNASLLDNHCTEDFTVTHGFGMTRVHCSDKKFPAANNAYFEEAKGEYIQSFGNSEQLTKTESKGWSEALLASLPSWALLTNAYTNLLASQEVRESHGMHTCTGALAADKDQRLTTMEWSKRNLSGSPPSMMSMRPVDAIVEQANCFDMAAQNQSPAILERNALIAYHYEYPQQNALAVCKMDQTMIPFSGSHNRIKERRPRPKVNLDEETTRVWNLLLENINSDGIDGTDEEKRKWWEEERRVFRGRANSFIAKMRQVQGDRRFRPWKGSVVDSVIGVFLTQNVSDHLSSSAYMSMAARFPLKPNGGHQSCCNGGIDEKQDPLHFEQDSSGEDSVILQVSKNDSNDINKQVFFQNSSEDAESIGNWKSPSSDSSECGPSMSTELKISGFDSLNDRTTVLDWDQRALGDILSSQNSVVSSQSCIDSVGQPAYKKELRSHNFLEEESTSECGFVKLLQMQDRKASALEETRTRSEETGSNLEGSADHQDFVQSPNNNRLKENERLGTEECGLSEESAATSFQNTVRMSFEPQMRCNENHVSADYSSLFDYQRIDFVSRAQKHASASCEGIFDARRTTAVKGEVLNPGRKSVILDENNSMNKRTASGEKAISSKSKSGKNPKGKQEEVDWDNLRKQAQAKGKREKQVDTSDSVDWEAVRCADVGEIAQTIKDRGMNNRLAERIKDFLNRLVREHGSIDLEWLRDVPPDKAKEYLLSIKGLGLKSVECVRLLTLHHLAFPVDTNVGRIAVRLGWVPLQPLPESLQLHLLELYPVLESIQKYLWPRLCKLDQKKLYELHYHMITFGKVFCTKNKPNCNACPMRGECRHFASAYASSRLTLPAPEDKSIVMATENGTAYETPAEKSYHFHLTGPESTENPRAPCLPIVSQPIFGASTTTKPIIEEPKTPEPEPIVEEPQTPESEPELEPTQFLADIEDCYMENDNEIPTIDLNLEAFNLNVQNIIQNSVALQESESSNSLVVLTPEAASIPMPKLKNINRLRTEHQVYLLPDSHQLLKGLEKREEKDPCPYLLAIWAPGETINSVEPPERKCSLEASNQLCSDNACSSCNSIREANSQTVRGTLLIPSRTAMRGRFPLNGTYFQVNEVFADHETSLNPIDVPREWLWNLRRRTVYFGTSIPTIFKGLGPEDIMYCFWRGFVCVRGFDRATRAPRPLIARLHFPASRMQKNKGDTAESSLPKANV